MAKVTGLSGNEIYCLSLKNYTAGELVVGNSVNSVGFLGGMAAGFKGMAGGEITQVTQAIEESRIKPFDRMIAEAKQHGATGVTGVTSELKDFAGNTELLISASIYSLGVVGGLKSALKSFTKGEINDLTTLIHDARELAIGRLKSEADALNADEVVGVKTYIVELGAHLVELLAIGTAVKKSGGVTVKTPALPVQAIVQDKDTWIEGAFGFSLDRSE